MKKITTLPKKQFAMESAADATDNPSAEDSGENQDLLAATFPLNTTNLRRDFIEQAKQLKEKLVIGKTPERIKHPKNTYTLDSKGNLKGDMDLVKETGTTVTVDLTKRAEAVNEGVKKPTFRRKPEKKDSAVFIKDERESEDKQPTEAVACEARFPKFNKREQALVSGGDAKAVRARMKDGSLSKVRGRQILYTMGATEEEDEGADDALFTTAPSDAGKVLDDAVDDFVPTDTGVPLYKGDDLIGAIDTRVGDEFDVDVHYTSKDPLSGEVAVVNQAVANKVADVFESLGLSSKVLAAKEEYSVLFKEGPNISSNRWYALVADESDKNKVSQVTLTVKEGASKEQVEQYLYKAYSPDRVVSVSDVKY